jgi:hypothetical protein
VKALQYSLLSKQVLLVLWAFVRRVCVTYVTVLDLPLLLQ